MAVAMIVKIVSRSFGTKHSNFCASNSWSFELFSKFDSAFGAFQSGFNSGFEEPASAYPPTPMPTPGFFGASEFPGF